MKKLIFLPLFFILSNSLFAQSEEACTDRDNKFSIKLGIGVMQYNLNSFNNIASNNNFPILKDGTKPQFSIGFLIMDCIDKFDVDFNMSAALFTGRRTNAYRLNMSTFNFDFNFGYKIWNQNNHLISPSLGLGVMNYSFEYTANTGNTFAQSLQTPNFELSANTALGIYINPRIRYQYAFQNCHPFAIGLETGYRIGINTPVWKINRNQVLNGAPKADINGMYATVYLIF